VTLIFGQIVENEFKIAGLERVLEWVFRTNAGKINPPPRQVVDEIRQKVFKELKQKYPNSEITMIIEDKKYRVMSDE